MFRLFQKSSGTASSEPDDSGTQAFAEVADVLSEVEEHRDGHQVSCLPGVPSGLEGGSSHPTLLSLSVLLSVAELYWRSSSPTIAMPVLLEALALSKEYRLQYLASETVLNLAYAQVSQCDDYFFLVGAVG